MGKLFKTYLAGPGVYKCHACDTHLAKHSDILSKVLLVMLVKSRILNEPPCE